MRIVFDTNIYIAAFLGRGFLFELLNTVLDPKGGFSLYISEEIIEELMEKLEEIAGFSKKDEGNFMIVLRRFAYIVTPSEKIMAIQKDPDDNKILECAFAAKANLIVSMDKHLLRFKQFRGISIVHPKTFSFMLPKG